MTCLIRWPVAWCTLNARTGTLCLGDHLVFVTPACAAEPSLSVPYSGDGPDLLSVCGCVCPFPVPVGPGHRVPARAVTVWATMATGSSPGPSLPPHPSTLRPCLRVSLPPSLHPSRDPSSLPLFLRLSVSLSVSPSHRGVHRGGLARVCPMIISLSHLYPVEPGHIPARPSLPHRYTRASRAHIQGLARDLANRPCAARALRLPPYTAAVSIRFASGPRSPPPRRPPARPPPFPPCIAAASFHWIESMVYCSSVLLIAPAVPLWLARSIVKGLITFPLEGHSG